MAALYVKEHLKVKGKVYLLGGAGLEEEFTLHGLSYIGPGVSQKKLWWARKKIINISVCGCVCVCV